MWCYGQRMTRTAIELRAGDSVEIEGQLQSIEAVDYDRGYVTVTTDGAPVVREQVPLPHTFHRNDLVPISG